MEIKDRRKGGRRVMLRKCIGGVGGNSDGEEKPGRKVMQRGGAEGREICGG